MIKFIRTFTTFLSLSFCINLASSFQAAKAETILSKQDAAQMFAMPLIDWIVNVVAIKNAGVGDYAKANEFEYTLYYQSPLSTVAVTPSYSEKHTDKPFKLTMTTVHKGYDSEVTRSLADDVIKKMIVGWYEQMLPEYTVMTNYRIDAVSMSVTFTIFQRGASKEIDEIGNKSKGCWKNCIIRK